MAINSNDIADCEVKKHSNEPLIEVGLEKLTRSKALVYDFGFVENDKYGMANISGHLLLINESEPLITLNIDDVKNSANKWINEMALNWEDILNENDLKECRKKSEETTLPDFVVNVISNIDIEKARLYYMMNLGLFIFDDSTSFTIKLNKNNKKKCLKIINQIVGSMIVIVKESGNKNITINQIEKLGPMFKLPCIIFSDLTREIIKFENHSKCLQELINYLRSNKWEFEFHYSSMLEDDYLFIRYYTVGFLLTLEMILLIKGVHLNKEIEEHPFLRNYYHMCGMHWAFTNDIISLKKEIHKNEPENIVLIKCQKHSLIDAFREAEKEVNDLALRIREATIMLRMYFPDDLILSETIEIIENLCVGAMYWYHGKPPRYENVKYDFISIEHRPIIEFDGEREI